MFYVAVPEPKVTAYCLLSRTVIICLQIIDSYMRLNDWQSAIDWQQQVSSMYSKSVSLAIHSSVDLNLVRCDI